MKIILTVMAGLLLSASTQAVVEHSCAASAQSLFLACGFDVQEGYFEGLTVCGNTIDTEAAEECSEEVAEERGEDTEECTDVLEARLEF